MALVKFADKRRSWQHVQLDLLYTIDRPWLILHAELSSRCSERVSIFILEFSNRLTTVRSLRVNLLYFSEWPFLPKDHLRGRDISAPNSLRDSIS